MKILCIFYDREQRFLASDPEVDLAEHEVTVVHSQEEAVAMMEDRSRGIPPFHVILTDIMVPRSSEGTELVPIVLFLMRYVEPYLVEGVGIFVPSYFESQFTIDIDGYHTLVSSGECWTVTRTRDWPKLCQLVVDAVHRVKEKV